MLNLASDICYNAVATQTPTAQYVASDLTPCDCCSPVAASEYFLSN